MKTRILVLIVMISLTGIAAARNSGNVQRNNNRATCHLNNDTCAGSELQLKKVVRNKRNLNNRWQKSAAEKNKKSTVCQSSEVNKTQLRRGK